MRVYPHSVYELRRFAAEVSEEELLGTDATEKKVLYIGPSIRALDAKKDPRISRVDCTLGAIPQLASCQDSSADRLLFPLTLSAPTLIEMSDDQLQGCVTDIERIMKPDGQAHIFPIDKGFMTDGIVYDIEALETALAKRSCTMGARW